MENEQTIFMAKIQTLMTLFDEIDTLIEDSPSKQQKVDYELSDYLHLLQTKNNELSDEGRVEICNKLEELRLKREQLNNINLIAKTFNDHRQKLAYSNSRNIAYSQIKTTISRLNCDYNYRVLDEDTLNHYLQKNEKHKETKSKVDKDELIKAIKEGKSLGEIAEEFNITKGYVSLLKKELGLTRPYKKRG